MLSSILEPVQLNTDFQIVPRQPLGTNTTETPGSSDLLDTFQRNGFGGVFVCLLTRESFGPDTDWRRHIRQWRGNLRTKLILAIRHLVATDVRCLCPLSEAKHEQKDFQYRESYRRR